MKEEGMASYREMIAALRRRAGDDPAESGWLSEAADMIADLRRQLAEAKFAKELARSYALTLEGQLQDVQGQLTALAQPESPQPDEADSSGD